MNKRELGKYGERIAQYYLIKKGYLILDKNFYCRQGEIDIVAYKDKTLIFIEVKTRSTLKYGTPAEAVNNTKQTHIKKVAQYYMYKNHIGKINVRFDAVEILIRNKEYSVNHLLNIF